MKELGNWIGFGRGGMDWRGARGLVLAWIAAVAADFSFARPPADDLGPSRAGAPARRADRDEPSAWGLNQAVRDELLDHPRDAELLLRSGLALHRSGRPRAAADLYRRAASLDPKNGRLRYLLAHAYATAGDPRATAEAAAAVRADESLTDAHALLGVLLGREGRDEEALTSLERAWNASPPSVAAGRELARREIQRGRPESAARILEVCAIHNPRDVRIRKALADAQEQSDDVIAAKRTWEALIEQGDGGAEALARLHRISHRLGDPRLAELHLQRARQIDPLLEVSLPAGLEDGRRPDPQEAEFPSLVWKAR
jgi:tetratricopeptide (TPR) repeat protein